LCEDGKDNNNDGKLDSEDPTCFEMTILTSSACKEEYCNIESLKQMFFGYKVNVVDYATEDGKKMFEEVKTVNPNQTLPTFFFKDKK
jgi:hypothetical protein